MSLNLNIIEIILGFYADVVLIALAQTQIKISKLKVDPVDCMIRITHEFQADLVVADITITYEREQVFFLNFF